MKKVIIAAMVLLLACNKDPDLKNVDFRQEMRNFVSAISRYARQSNPSFLIIPQNGIELTTLNGEADAPPASLYLNDIDGVGQEDLFYGYVADNQATPPADNAYLLAFLQKLPPQGKAVLVTDYCSDASKMDDSWLQNNRQGFISFAAPDRQLRLIPAYPPAPRAANSDDINQLTDAKNFLYLINSEGFTSRQAFLDSLAATSFDLIIMDAFYEGALLTADEVNSLKTKQGGGRRLVVAYMSIGEAEDYRYYWQASWSSNPPGWLSAPNPDWAGNFKVKYWQPEWQAIIYGSEEAYLDKILAAGFDGAYLDIIDAFDYFESL